MKDIIKELKAKPHYFWFKVSKKGKFTLLCKTETKKEANECIKDKASKMKDGQQLVSMYLKFYKKWDSPLIGGPLALIIQFKEIRNNKIKSVKDDDRSGVVWWSKDEIEKNGFKSADALKVLQALYNRDIKLPVLGNSMFDELEI